MAAFNKNSDKGYYHISYWAKKLGYDLSLLKYLILMIERDGIKVEKRKLKYECEKIYLDNKSISLIEAKRLELRIKTKHNRFHYPIPAYKRLYSVYQYDQKKYNGIYKRLQQLALKYDEKIYYRVNPYRVLQLCYVKDEYGELQKLGDEKHIFRNRVLQNILKEIADYLLIAYELLPNNDVLKYLFKRTHIIVYLNNDINQAEILETIGKSLGCRLKFHIELLRNLRKGLEIEDAVKLTINRNSSRFLICHN